MNRIFGMFGVQLLAAAFSVIAHFSVARFAGVEAYGAYALAMTLILPGSVIARRGWEIGTIRFVSDGVSSPDMRKVNFAFALRRLLPGVIVVGVLVGSICAMTIGSIHGAPAGAVAMLTAVACSGIAVSGLVSVGRYAVSGSLVGYAAEGIVRPALFISLVLFAASSEFHGNWAVLAAQAAACVLAVSIGLVGTGVVRARSPVPGAQEQYDKISKSSMAVMWSSILYQSLIQSDVFLIGMIASLEVSGVYAFCKQIAMLILFPVLVAQSSAAPSFSAAITRHDNASSQVLSDRITAIGVIGATAACLSIIVLGRFIYEWSGIDVSKVGMAPYFLFCSSVIVAGFGSSALALNVSGGQRTVALAYAVALAAVVSGGYLAGRSFGVAGVSAVYLAVVGAVTVALSRAALSQVGIRTWATSGGVLQLASSAILYLKAAVK